MEDNVGAFDGVVSDYRERIQELQQMQRDIREVRATARTRNGEVSLEVGAQGELKNIRFHPDALARMTPQQLAHTIMKLVGEATKDASDQAKEMTAKFLPEEMAERLRGGETDLSAFMPDAPRIPDMPQD